MRKFPLDDFYFLSAVGEGVICSEQGKLQEKFEESEESLKQSLQKEESKVTKETTACVGRVEGLVQVEIYECLIAPNFSADWFSPSELSWWSGGTDKTAGFVQAFSQLGGTGNCDAVSNA